MHSTRCFLAALALLCTTAVAGAAALEDAVPTSLPSSLQLGSIPRVTLDSGTLRWSVAVPLPVPLDRASLGAPVDPRLSLQAALDGTSSWLVLEADTPGPVSGLLELEPAQGASRSIAIAAEVVAVTGTPPPLLVTGRHRTPLVRFVRVRKDAALTLSGEAGSLCERLPGDQGWHRVEIPVASHQAEAGGRLRIGDTGLSQDLHGSVVESISVRAARTLTSGWDYSDLMTYRETLAGGGLEGRAVLRASNPNGTQIRFFNLRYDRANDFHTIRPRDYVAIPRVGSSVPTRLVRMRAPAEGRKKMGGPLLLHLAGDRAVLIDPQLGIVDTERIQGFSFTGHAAQRRLNGRAVRATYLEDQSARRYLARWTVQSTPDDPLFVRHMIFGPSLNTLAGNQPLAVSGLRTLVHRENWPQGPLRENTLLSASVGGSLTRLNVLELLVRDPGNIAARRLYRSPVRGSFGDALPALRLLRDRRAGQNGWPARMSLYYPTNSVFEIVNSDSDGRNWAPVARRFLPTDAFAQAGLSLVRKRMLLAEERQGALSLARGRYRQGSFIPEATGSLRASPVELRASERRARSWLLTESDGRYDLRLLDNGLRPGTELPPVAVAGPDLQFRAMGRAGALATLQGQVRAAGAVRWVWIADRVTFVPDDQSTARARFPVGTTRVRLRCLNDVRGKAAPLAGTDVMRVHVAVPTAAPPVEGLTTRLTSVAPNPANPRVTIGFTLDRRGPVRLEVFDVRGRHVRTVLDEVRGVGGHDVVWDGSDDQGRSVSSGAYRVRMIANGVENAAAVVLVR